MGGYPQASCEELSAAEALAGLWERFRTLAAGEETEADVIRPAPAGPRGKGWVLGEAAGDDEGETVLEAARLAWLDWAGVALYGLGTGLGRSLASLVGDPAALAARVAGFGAAPEPNRAAGGCPGEPLGSAWSLALLLGAAAHAAELDDTLPDSMVHAGAPVVAAAWTSALLHGAGTAQFFRAVAFGYEVAGRIGQAVNSPPGLALHRRGFHPTGVVGVLGAAAAAGALGGLDRQGLAAALTLAASMGGGILEFLSGGGDSKALHAGKAAADGVVAAALAACGLRGPRRALEGRDGFFRAYGSERPPGGGALGQGGRPDAGELPRRGSEGEFRELPGDGAEAAEGLARTVEAASAHVVRTLRKYHACCHHCQPSVEALADLARRAGLRGEEMLADVTAIEVVLPTMAHYQVASPIEAKRRPSSRLEAQLSLPYCLAAWLVLGHLGPQAFEDPHRNDPRILEVAGRVHPRPSAEMDARFARGEMPAVVRVHRRRGDVLEAASGFRASGSRTGGLRDQIRGEEERIREKWSFLLGPGLDSDGEEALWEAVRRQPLEGLQAGLARLQVASASQPGHGVAF